MAIATDPKPFKVAGIPLASPRWGVETDTLAWYVRGHASSFIGPVDSLEARLIWVQAASYPETLGNLVTDEPGDGLVLNERLDGYSAGRELGVTRIQYVDRYGHLDHNHVQVMYKTLDAIERGMTRIAARFGRVDTFAGQLARLADVTGVRQYVRHNPRCEHNHSDFKHTYDAHRYQISTDIQDAQYWVGSIERAYLDDGTLPEAL